MLLAMHQGVLLLSLLKPLEEDVVLLRQEGLLEGDFYELFELALLHNADVLLIAVLNEDHALVVLPDLADQLDVPEQLLKGDFARLQHVEWILNDVSQGRHLLLHYAVQHMHVALLHSLFVVIIYLFLPEFLESHLLLHLVLKDSELRSEGEGGKDILFFECVDGLRLGPGGFGTLLDAMSLAGLLHAGLYLLFDNFINLEISQQYSYSKLQIWQLFTTNKIKNNVSHTLKQHINHHIANTSHNTCPSSSAHTVHLFPQSPTFIYFIAYYQSQSAYLSMYQSAYLSMCQCCNDFIIVLMRKTKQQKAPSSQQQLSSQESIDQGEEELDEEDQDHILGGDQEDELNEQERDEQILRRIVEQGAAQGPQLELTWNAVWALKQKEIELKSNLNSEIQKIKNKYEMLKQPLYQQISNVALGKKVQTKLYKPQGLPCRGDPLKMAPQPIQNFWGQILDKEGLMKDEVDVECFSKLKQFTCQLINLQYHEVRIVFTFKQQTQYFANRSLEVSVKYNDEKAPNRQIKQNIKYKKKERKTDSIFTQLFDPATSLQDSVSTAHELYQVYSNALYFYFLQESADEGGEDEDEDDDDDQVEGIRPGKKVKASQQKKEAQKPQCKNQ